jgi:6-phosphogluconolactonase
MPSPSDTAADSVHVYPDLDGLSRAAAEHIVSHVRRVLAQNDHYALALAGGSTPKRLYELLADLDPSILPWERIHLFWGDERFVPPGHEKSNVTMAQRTLIDAIDIPERNVHPIQTHREADRVAADYEGVLHQAFDGRDRTFDLALLGLGGDGHTASLFPEHEPSIDDPRWVRVVEAPRRHDIATRITCTLPVFNRAAQCLFLVSGARKHEAVQAVLDEGDLTKPAAHVRPQERRLWFLDEAARGA